MLKLQETPNPRGTEAKEKNWKSKNEKGERVHFFSHLISIFSVLFWGFFSEQKQGLLFFSFVLFLASKLLSGPSTPVLLLKWWIKEGLCECLPDKVKSMSRTMEQRNKNQVGWGVKKKSVYHNTLGWIARLQPITIWLSKQRMQAGPTSRANKAIKMPWTPRKEHGASDQMQYMVLLSCNACDLWTHPTAWRWGEIRRGTHVERIYR